MLSRIAVLPPSDATGRPLSEVQGGIDGYDAPSQSLATLLADEAGQQLARYGFDVVDPTLVDSTTRGRVPSSAATAAEIVGRRS